MGRNSSLEEIPLRVKANPHVDMAHDKEDSKIDNTKYVAKTIKDQQACPDCPNQQASPGCPNIALLWPAPPPTKINGATSLA